MDDEDLESIGRAISEQSKNNGILLTAILSRLITKDALTETDVKDMLSSLDDVAHAMREDGEGAADSLLALRDFIHTNLFSDEPENA